MASDQMLMGFEVETDGIKVRHDDEDQILVILKSSDGKWQLTTDTQDRAIAKDGWVNLECRTAGGLTKHEIAQHIGITKIVLSRIKQACDAQPNGQCELRATDFQDIQVDGIRVEWVFSQERILMATKRLSASKGAYEALPLSFRPQLTFLFPLRLTRRVFHELLGTHDKTRLRMLNTNNQPKEIKIREKKEKMGAQLIELEECTHAIEEIMHGIRSGQIRDDDSRDVETLYSLRKKKKELQQAIERAQDQLDILTAQQDFFTSSMLDYLFPYLSPRLESGTIKKLDDVKLNTNLDGLCLLFGSYVYDLFVENQQNPLLNEPGPKGFLKVMSRFSFSDMHRSLSATEQNQFIDIMSTQFRTLLSRSIKPYRRDAPELCKYHERDEEKGTFISDIERTTLGHWLESICYPMRDVYSGVFEDRGPKDLLSPPLCTSRSYSMGAVFNNLYPGHALIEARGYANSCRTETAPEENIDNVAKLIQGESERFFSIGGNE